MPNALQDQINHHARAARHILAEKGSARWSKADQEVFDRHCDEAERAKARLDLLNAASGFDVLDTFIRHSQRSMSAEQVKTIRNAMSTTTGSEGGFVVAADVAQQFISILKGYGYVRGVASQMTTTVGSPLTVPTSDGSSEVGEILAQNGASASLDPSFAAASIPTYKFGSKLITVPIELLQDSAIDMPAFLMVRVKERIGRIQNAKFTTGTGTGEPTGLVAAATVGKTGTTGQTTTVIYDDLVDLADSLDDAHLTMPDTTPGAVQPTVGWMMGSAMRKVVRKLKDTNGRPIWMPGHSDGKQILPAMLLDYPCFFNTDMPTPAANAKSIIFGNYARYLIRDALQVSMFRFDDSAFINKGQVGFLALARAGGQLLDSGAVKAYQHSAT